MKKILWILPLAILIWTIHFSSLSHSIEVDPEVKNAYMASDYVTTSKLLEQQIKQIKEKALKSEKVNFSDLYMKYISLAHIYMRRLNRPDDALSKYQEATEIRKSSEKSKNLPPIEFLYVAEIYEGKNNFSKAMEYYQTLLQGLASLSEKGGDDLTIIMAEDLTTFTKYQIDGLNLKARGKRI